MIDEEIKKAYSKVTKQCETKSDRVSYKDAKNSFRAIREENEMEFSGVYHKTSEQMSYALDEDRLIVLGIHRRCSYRNQKRLQKSS